MGRKGRSFGCDVGVGYRWRRLGGVEVDRRYPAIFRSPGKESPRLPGIHILGDRQDDDVVVHWGSIKHRIKSTKVVKRTHFPFPTEYAFPIPSEVAPK